MKKALEWELSLDSRDLRSHAWYYSAIPRQRAEEIVEKDGDFLVRDCVSQPGNYVLTCKSKGAILHFVINKVSAVGCEVNACMHVRRGSNTKSAIGSRAINSEITSRNAGKWKIAMAFQIAHARQFVSKEYWSSNPG